MRTALLNWSGKAFSPVPEGVAMGGTGARPRYGSACARAFWIVLAAERLASWSPSFDSTAVLEAGTYIGCSGCGARPTMPRPDDLNGGPGPGGSHVAGQYVKQCHLHRSASAELGFNCHEQLIDLWPRTGLRHKRHPVWEFLLRGRFVS